MKLILLPPAEPVKVTQEEVESETIKLLTVFAGIKQRVSKSTSYHQQLLHVRSLFAIPHFVDVYDFALL